MKKLVVFLMGLLLVSCVKDVNPLTEQEAAEINYNSAFENVIGQITDDSPETWGFPSGTMRSAMPNSNEWGTSNGIGYLNYPKPADITDEERAKVLAVFNEVGEKEYESILDIDSFFVQQVYCGPKGYLMNELATTVDYKREIVTKCWWPLEQEIVETSCEPFDDIINNFNTGKYSGNSEQGCMLMYNSATLDFSYKTSQSGGQRWYKHWRMEKIDGNYYVGFDHEAVRQADTNDNEEDVRDYIYNDWIIKIVPGIGHSDKILEEGRIICEDLGTIGDFDFNDVVFDATIYESGKTEITILAAGGTLDISVDGVDIGEVMGKMVNTGLTTVDTYTFTSKNTYSRLIDIPIVVSKTNSVGIVTSYELSAEKGKAPQKICVPKTFKWCKEYKSIKDAYLGFSTWVIGGKFWSGEINSSFIYE